MTRPIFILMMISLILLGILLSPYVVRAEMINMEIIAQIESSNNNNDISYLGAKYGRGKYQVSEILLKEYNNYNKTNISPEMLYSEDTNEMIARWYLEKRIPQMLKYYGIKDTVEARLHAYSAGIGNVVKGRMPEETKDYLRKYNTLDKDLQTELAYGGSV